MSRFAHGHPAFRAIPEAEVMWEPHIEFESLHEVAEPIEVYREAAPRDIAERWLSRRTAELGDRVLRIWMIEKED